MARKKSVSITRKPTAGRAGPVLEEPAGFDFVLDPPVSPIAVDQSHAEPAIRCPLGRLVYRTVFCVSYGVVFGAVLLGRLVPGGKLVGRGLRDGAAAAGRYFEEDDGPASSPDWTGTRLRA